MFKDPKSVEHWFYNWFRDSGFSEEYKDQLLDAFKRVIKFHDNIRDKKEYTFELIRTKRVVKTILAENEKEASDLLDSCMGDISFNSEGEWDDEVEVDPQFESDDP